MGKSKRGKEDIKHSLFPNAFIEADGAFRDGNVPAAVGRLRFDCGHLWKEGAIRTFFCVDLRRFYTRIILKTDAG